MKLVDRGMPSHPQRPGDSSPGITPLVPTRRRRLLGAGLAVPAALAALPVLAQSGAPPAAGAAARPRVVVLNSRDASVSLIDQTSFAEISRVTVGKEPHHLYPTPDNTQLIVASAVSNELHFLDPVSGDIVGRLRNIDDPYQLVFSPDRRWFVTAALRLDRVDIYSYDGTRKEIVARVAVPKAPSHLWFSNDSKMVFVTLQDSDDIAAIEVPSGKLLWRMPIGKQPAGILLSPDEKHLFVGVMGEDHVTVVDWREQRVVTRLRTGAGAHNFRGYGDQRRLLVTNRVANTISTIDMTQLTITDTIAVPGGPDCMELADDGRTLWVTARWTKRVSIVDLVERRIVRSIPVGRSPHGVYLHNRVANV